MPRFRYDKLMYLAWKRFLPLSLNYLLFFVGVMCFFVFVCLFVFWTDFYNPANLLWVLSHSLTNESCT